MRMSYRTYPTDYIQELKQQGKRKKARAFMEYWDDMEMGEHHTERFYAKSWEVSPSTAHLWIREFNNEIDKFLAHWQIKNQQHYNYAQKSIEQKSSKSSKQEARKQGKVKKSIEQQSNEDFNIYNNDDKSAKMHFDKTFNDLYFTYSINTKFKGKKEDAYKEWLKIKDSIDPKELKRAIVLYLHDKEVTKRYNFANFLKNEVYLSYMDKRVKINIDEKWIEGVYDEELEEFITSSKSYTLYQDRFIELFKEGRLEFVR